jgi:hypothetical protein
MVTNSCVKKKEIVCSWTVENENQRTFVQVSLSRTLKVSEA